MNNSNLVNLLGFREISITPEHIFGNSKADSGGERDLNFLKFLLDSRLLTLSETVLKRTAQGMNEEYYLERYKKMGYESDRHFLCRRIIQDELKRIDINTINDVNVGNMDILRSSGNYDIIAEDFSAVIDIGLTPARNYFRCLTDLKVKNYLITAYFDDYMDDIILSVFSRGNDEDFINTVREYQESYKLYTPAPQPEFGKHRDNPVL